MADRKQYEMLFALNASMNGNFQGTFSKAQQEFSKLGKEIQELQKLQSNVSSYQKQEQAVASTSAKLSNLQQQEALLARQIEAVKSAEGQDAAATAALEREKLKLEQRIKDTETALERQNQKLEATGQKLQQAGVDTNNLTQADARLAEQLQELQARQEKAADSAASFGERAVQGIEAVQSALAAAGIADALGEIKDAYMECVETAAGFEESMSNVRALSGATAQEMAELTAKAKELGAETKYTAQESADAMGYMAMAGWDAQQMISGMDGVISLAAAAGEDLAMVSDIVTDNLTAFGMQASDTARFADVLAAAATNSNTSVGIMGETFKNSAAIAGALGYSVEDVAVAVGLMANAGVKGSNAGTALKNTLNGLVSGVTLTSAAFGEYEFSAVRADGTMKGFADTVDELRECFNQMTEAERFSNAQAIAGERTYNGLLAILNATDEDYASLTQSINECSGAAQHMAEIKMDNLNGQLTLMNSAWDALKTTIGEQFIPEMRSLYEVGTDVFSGINEFTTAHPGIVRGIAATAAVIGTVTVAVTGLTAAMKLAAVASALVPGAGQILAVTAAVAGVVGVVTALTTAADDGIPSVKELTEAARDMRDAMDEAGGAYEQNAAMAMASAEAAGVYIGRLEALEAAAGENARSSQEYQNTLALLLRTMPELSDSITETTDSYGRSVYTLETSTQALRENTEELRKNAEARAYQEYINALYDEYGDVIQEMAENKIKLSQTEGKLKTAEENRAVTLERMAALEEKAREGGGALGDEYASLQEDLKGYEREIDDAWKELDNLSNAIYADADAAAEAEAAIKGAEEAVEQLTGATAEQTEAEAGTAEQARELKDVIESVTEQVAVLTEAYNEAYNAAKDSISGQYSLWDNAADVAATSASSINAALESQISYWEDYNANLQSLTERSADIEGLSDMIATFADGSADSVNAIAGMSSASDEELRTMVAKWQELQEQQSETAGSLAELVTGFPELINGLVTAMEEGVEGMSMPDEAQESARSTIQAFIDEADTMLPAVQDAYARLGQAAASSLGIDLKAAPYNDSAWAANRTTPMFASGTSNAPPGWAWVGEDGPELMRLHGGETILPAQVSQEYAALSAYASETGAYTAATANTAAIPAVEAVPASYDGASGSVVVEVHIHLEGSASTETVQALEDYVRRGELKAAVIDAMEEVQSDTLRGAYV